MSQAAIDARDGYAHLLKPLRELAGSFDIDICHELEEYAAQVDEVSVNFAEAALVVQGSAMIYSKKVECLYRMLLETLDSLVDARIAKRKKNKANNSPDDEEDDLATQADDGHLLNLDILETGDKTHDMLLVASPMAKLKHNYKEAVRLNRIRTRSNPDSSILMSRVHPSGALLSHSLHEGALADLDKSFLVGVVGQKHRRVSFAPQPFDDDDGGMDMMDLGVVDEFPTENGELEKPSMDFSLSILDANTNEGFEEVVKEKVKQVYPTLIEEDMWEMLDAHAEGTKATPFRKGKTWKTPVLTQAQLSLPDYILNPRYTGAAILNHTYHPGLDSFAASELKWRKKKLRELKTPKDVDSSYYAEVEDDDHFDAGGEFEPLMDMDVNTALDNMEDDNPEEDFGMGDIGEDFGNDFDDDEGGEGYTGFSTQVHEHAQHIEGPTGPSYEDECRKHIEAYIKTAERYADQTNISRRVANWRERVTPLLHMEDSHPEYDIYDYGHKVIDTLDHTKKPVYFSEALKSQDVEGKEWQVCRTFLAVLQLANNGNVKLVPSKDGKTEFKLQVLNSEILLPQDLMDA